MTRRVAIIGAGIAGMSAALFLARSGWGVDLYERFEAPSPAGAGLLLQPTGLAVLSELGLVKTVRRRGARIERLEGRTRRGARVMDLAYAAYHPGYYGLGVHRGVLFEALYEVVSETSLIRFSGAMEIEALVESDEGARLKWALGETEPYPLVVVADGARSTLRDQLRGAVRDRAYEWACIWTTAPDPDQALAGPMGAVLDQRYEGARRFAGILPIGSAPEHPRKRSAALFWSIRADAHEPWLDAGLDAWKAEVKTFWPRFHRFIEPIEDVRQTHLAVYRDVVLRRRPFGRENGRVVFIGDAAHAMSPQLGQGANLALLDALRLGETLARDDVEAGLRDYRRMRRAQTAWYQRASRWLTPLFQANGAAPGYARNLFFRSIGRLPWVRREMLAAQSGLKTGMFSRDKRDWTPGTHPPR